jgi:GntR family phosphonate transport system transcriptional regulator
MRSDKHTGTHGTRWESIAQALRDEIRHGQILPGQRLASGSALADRFGANRHTVRRALAELHAQGLIKVSQGSAAHVMEQAVELALGRRPSHSLGLMQAGLPGRLHVLAAERLRASTEVARHLNLPPRTSVWHLNVLGEGAGHPLHVGDRYFPARRFPDLPDQVRETGSISAALAEHGVHDYQRIFSVVQAEMPQAATANALRQAGSRPVLCVTSVNADKSQVPIEFARTWFAGDRVRLSVQAEPA